MDCTLGGTPLCEIYVSFEKRLCFLVSHTISLTLPRFYSVNMSHTLGNISDDNLRAIKSSKLAVMILSNEFFLSKNTMVELSTVFDARVKIWPVFFDLSIEDLSDKEKIQKWQMRWEEFASEDSSINVSLWGHALQRLQSITGFVLKSYNDKGFSYYDKFSDVLDGLCEIIKLIVPQPQSPRYKSGDLMKLPAAEWSTLEPIRPTYGESVQIPFLEEALKISLQSSLDCNLISIRRKVKVPSEVALTMWESLPWASIYGFQRSYRLLSCLHPVTHRRQILVELERHNFSLELGSPEIEVQELYNLLNTNDKLTCFVLSGDHSALVNCVELLYKASLTEKSLVTTDLEALLNWLKAFAPQADRTITHDAIKWSGTEHLLAFCMKPIKGFEEAKFSRLSFNGSKFAVDYPCEGSLFNLLAISDYFYKPPYDKLSTSGPMFSYDNLEKEAKHLSMPLSPKIENKDVQKHSSEISGHDQTTSSHLPGSDPNFILRGFEPTHSSKISDHDQTTSSHLPESGKESLITDGKNDCEGVWIQFELVGQNPQIIVGAQYFRVLDIMEFFFESPEDMAACVGVGLSHSKVTLDENLIITVQQLESHEWNSSKKVNRTPMLSDRDFDLIIPIDISSQQKKMQVYVNVESESSERKYGVGFDGIRQFRSCETYGGSQDEDFWPLLYKMTLFALIKLAKRQHTSNVAATRDNPVESSKSSSSRNISIMLQNLFNKWKQKKGQKAIRQHTNNVVATRDNPIESSKSNSSHNISNMFQNLFNKWKREKRQEADGEDQGGDEGNGGGKNYTNVDVEGTSTLLDMKLTVHVLPLPNSKVYCPRQGGLEVDCSTIGYHLECASIEPKLVLVFNWKQGEKNISINAMSRLALETNSSVYEDPNLFHWYHDRISILLGCADTQRAAYLNPDSTKIYGGEETTGGTHSISSTTSSTIEKIQVKSNQVSGKIKVGGVLEVGAQGGLSASKKKEKARNSTENYEEPTKDVCNGFKYENHSYSAFAKFELLYPQLEDKIGDINKTSLHGKGLFSTITPKIEGIWRPLNEEERSPYMLKIDRSLKVHRKEEPRLDIKQDYLLSFYVNHAMTHLDQRKKKNSKEDIWLIEEYSKSPPDLPGVIVNMSKLYNDEQLLL